MENFLAHESGAEAPHSKTLARLQDALTERGASWSAAVLRSFGIALGLLPLTLLVFGWVCFVH